MMKSWYIILLLLLQLATSASAEPWKFIATGDSRGGGSGPDEVNTNVLREIAIAITNEGAELVIFSGDLIQGYPATESALQLWTNTMAPVYETGIEVYPVRGNHDVGTGWVEVFGPDIPNNGPAGEMDMTFWVTNRNAIFVGLDQYVNRSRVNQDWLDGVLASNTALHVFPCGHEPAFKVNHTDCLDDYPSQRDAFWHSLEQAGSKAYFCGHDHFLDIMRLDDGDGNITNDLYQYIVGTAGAPPYTPGPYNGSNGEWTPVKVHDESDYGYVLGEVDGPQVTLTWKRRYPHGTFVVENVLTYNVLDQLKARDPVPIHGSTNTLVDTTLSWTPPTPADTHRIYLGTNQSAIASATTNAPQYQGTATNALFTPPADLEYDTTHYWRIDEVLASGDVATGVVWQFTTITNAPVIRNDAAVDITHDSATLTGTLLSSGNTTAHITVFWGTNDGGQVEAAWGHTNDLGFFSSGAFETSLTNLIPETSYLYRCYATNAYGTAWATQSIRFVTQPNMDKWPYKRQVQCNGYDKSENLINFPLLVILSASNGVDYSQFTSPTGADLRFTESSDLTVLNHEIEQWNTNGNSFVWVQIPEFSSDTALWAYWGNPAATNPPSHATKDATWSADFSGVWHLNETNGWHADATAYSNNGQPLNGINQDAIGVIDGANAFDGADDSVSIHDSSSLKIDNAITISAWIRSDAWTGEHVIVRKDDDYRLYDRDLGDGGPYAMTLKLKGLSTEEVCYGIENYTTGQWYYIAGTYDSSLTGNNLSLYTDGERVAGTNSSGQIDMTTDHVIIGAKLGTSYFFDGLIDEVRISRTCRSSNWIWACWMNQKPGSDLTSLGPVIEVDSDNDGLADAWELRYFKDLSTSSGSNEDDWDGDSSPDIDEYAAGTNPTNPASCLAISEIRQDTGTAHVIEWQSVSGRLYMVEQATNLLSSWSTIVSNLPATEPQNVHTVAPVEAESEFYRINLQTP